MKQNDMYRQACEAGSETGRIGKISSLNELNNVDRIKNTVDRILSCQ